MRLFGYAIALNDRLLDNQLNALNKAGVETHKLFTDDFSVKNRDGLAQLIKRIEKGDKIFIKNLDRLGRDTSEMIRLIRIFDDMGVTIEFLDAKISTEGSAGQLFLSTLKAVALAEQQRLIEKTKLGRIEARAKGVKFGRRRSINREEVLALRNAGFGATDISRRLKIGRSTVYQILRAM